MESPTKQNSSEKAALGHRTPKRTRHRRSSSEWQTPSSNASSSRGRNSRRLSFLNTPVRSNSFGVVSRDDERDNDAENHDHDDDDDNDDNHSHTLVLSASSHRINVQSPKTPRSRHSEMFLSPSPKLKSPLGHVSKEPVKPISEISQNLKTRLNYAYMKYQNGWSDKTLNELESELNVVAGSNYVNKFALDINDTLQNTASNINREPTANINDSGKYNNKYNNTLNDKDTSAHWALLQALSENKKKRATSKQETSEDDEQGGTDTAEVPRLNVTPFPPETNKPIEKVAVETLISLAAPLKAKDGDADTDVDETDVETASNDE